MCLCVGMDVLNSFPLQWLLNPTDTLHVVFSVKLDRNYSISGNDDGCPIDLVVQQQTHTSYVSNSQCEIPCL